MGEELAPGGLAVFGGLDGEVRGAGQGGGQQRFRQREAGDLVIDAVARVAFEGRLLVAVHGVEEHRERGALGFLDLVADHEVQEAHTAQGIDVGMHRGDHTVGGLQGAAGQEGRVGVGVEDDQVVFAAVVVDRAQEMLLDRGEAARIVREGVFRDFELAGDQVEPPGRTVRTQNGVDIAVARRRRERGDGEAQPVLRRRGGVLGVQAGALEQRDHRAIDA